MKTTYHQEFPDLWQLCGGGVSGVAMRAVETKTKGGDGVAQLVVERQT